MINNKKKLGQFNTTNVDFILKGFESLVKDKEVIDPFAGAQDLLNWAKKNNAKNVKGFDIDPNLIDNDKIYHNDSLLIIPDSEFLLTNPPYLANNKMTQEQKSKYMLDNGCDDFYLLAIKRIVTAKVKEGIIIIPVNFLSAENSNQIRSVFFSKFFIKKIKYFKFQVFDDTTYNVVAFHYVEKNINSDSQELNIEMYSNFDSAPELISFSVEKKFHYKIAGADLEKILNYKTLKIQRLTEDQMDENPGEFVIKAFFNDKKSECEYKVNKDLYFLIKRNIILLNCIDTNSSESGWIRAEDIRTYDKDVLVGKLSSRNIAYILIDGISIRQQEEIIKQFNSILFSLRKKYKSLFLTNFRDNDRKRISFEFCYKLISFCLDNLKK